ncbi:MAG: hypothetical protein PV358_17965, partial [Acidimicrobiales bacterium]|nr:hypothetical protein [Acidimicrobiales bacterium]
PEDAEDPAPDPARAPAPAPEGGAGRDVEPELDDSDTVDEPERRDPVPDYPRATKRPSGRVAAGRTTRR